MLHGIDPVLAISGLAVGLPAGLAEAAAARNVLQSN
jgi:hypothetical protein